MRHEAVLAPSLLLISLVLSDAAVMAHVANIPRVGAYECLGASSGADKAREYDPFRLRRALVLLSRAARAEASVARSIGCEPMHSATSEIFIVKRLGDPIRTKDAEWVVAKVTLSEPGATGYDFDAVVRLPLEKAAR